MNDDDAELLGETLRRRASIETRTGLKWNTADTVALLIIDAKLGALGKEPREPDRRPPPMSW